MPAAKEVTGRPLIRDDTNAQDSSSAEIVPSTGQFTSLVIQMRDAEIRSEIAPPFPETLALLRSALESSPLGNVSYNFELPRSHGHALLDPALEGTTPTHLISRPMELQQVQQEQQQQQQQQGTQNIIVFVCSVARTLAATAHHFVAPTREPEVQAPANPSHVQTNKAIIYVAPPYAEESLAESAARFSTLPPQCGVEKAATWRYHQTCLARMLTARLRGFNLPPAGTEGVAGVEGVPLFDFLIIEKALLARVTPAAEITAQSAGIDTAELLSHDTNTTENNQNVTRVVHVEVRPVARTIYRMQLDAIDESATTLRAFELGAAPVPVGGGVTLGGSIAVESARSAARSETSFRATAIRSYSLVSVSLSRVLPLSEQAVRLLCTVADVCDENTIHTVVQSRYRSLYPEEDTHVHTVLPYHEHQRQYWTPNRVEFLATIVGELGAYYPKQLSFGGDIAATAIFSSTVSSEEARRQLDLELKAQLSSVEAHASGRTESEHHHRQESQRSSATTTWAGGDPAAEGDLPRWRRSLANASSWVVTGRERVLDISRLVDHLPHLHGIIHRYDLQNRLFWLSMHNCSRSYGIPTPIATAVVISALDVRNPKRRQCPQLVEVMDAMLFITQLTGVGDVGPPMKPSWHAPLCSGLTRYDNSVRRMYDFDCGGRILKYVFLSEEPLCCHGNTIAARWQVQLDTAHLGNCPSWLYCTPLPQLIDCVPSDDLYEKEGDQHTPDTIGTLEVEIVAGPQGAIIAAVSVVPIVAVAPVPTGCCSSGLCEKLEQKYSNTGSSKTEQLLQLKNLPVAHKLVIAYLHDHPFPPRV